MRWRPRSGTHRCSHQASTPALAPRPPDAKDALGDVCVVTSHPASRCSLVHKAGPGTVSRTPGWGRPQHAQRLRGFQHLSRCAPPACVFSGMNVPRGMRVVSINPPWVTSAASCRVQGPVINSQNYLYSHELLQYELQKKSRPVPRKEKKSVKICVELLLSQQILLLLASESTALHFRLFLAFRKRGPNANTAGKDEATERGVSAGKGGEMPAVEGGAASRAA